MPTSTYLELLDWRRRVAELFVAVRQKPADATTLAWFRAAKDALFRDHPQSPVPWPERPAFVGLPYWPYDPAARVIAQFVEDEPPLPEISEPTPGASVERHNLQTSDAAPIAFRRIGRLDLVLHGQALSLGALWIEGYAGGLFVPFTDATSGHESYGGGRYLVDTIKSADFGSDAAANAVVLDFNYAYHPSCAYDPRWVCPLAPPENRLAVPIEVGEKLR